MSSWTDIIKAFIEFLNKPNGLGVLVLLSGMLLTLFMTPIGVLTYINIDGTNRIVSAIRELKGSLEELRIAERR
jgi:uncharacterized membrane protein